MEKESVKSEKEKKEMRLRKCEDTGWRKMKVITWLSMTMETRMSSIKKNRGGKTSRSRRRLGKRREMGQHGTNLVVQLASLQRTKLVF